MTELLAGGLALVSSLIQVVIILLNIIGLFKIYQKMGKPGWKGIIPFYNMYGLYDELWDKKYFWGYLLAQAVMLNPSSPSGLLFSVADLVLAVAMIVVVMKLYIKLAKAFGKGTGFGVLTFFFAPICLAVLGFGSAAVSGRRRPGFCARAQNPSQVLQFS